MPRLRNTATGVVVNVSDDKAERLGTQAWEPADSAPKRKSAKASGTTPAQSDNS